MKAKGRLAVLALSGLLAPALLLVRPGTSWLLALVPLALLLQAWTYEPRLVQRVSRREWLPLTALNPAVLFMALALLASMWATPDLELSLSKIAGLLSGWLLFYTVLRYTRTRAAWNTAFFGFIGLGAGAALLGLAGTRWFTTKLTSLNALTGRLPRFAVGLPGAPMGIHPNILAGALLWLLPAVVFGALALARRPDWFKPDQAGFTEPGWRDRTGMLMITAAAALIAGVLVLAQSRGAYLAAGLTMGGLVLALLPRRARLTVLALGLLALASGLWWAGNYGWGRLLGGSLFALPAGEGAFSTVTFAQRLEIWSRAVWAIRDAPVTGLGMDIFRVAQPLLYPIFSISPGYNLGHAHNELLQAALDLGLPGLVAYLTIQLGAAVMLVRLLKAGGAVRLLALGLGGGLVAHFLFGLTDAIALGGRPGIFFWILLGLIAGLYRLAVLHDGVEEPVRS